MALPRAANRMSANASRNRARELSNFTRETVARRYEKLAVQFCSGFRRCALESGTGTAEKLDAATSRKCHTLSIDSVEVHPPLYSRY